MLSSYGEFHMVWLWKVLLTSHQASGGDRQSREMLAGGKLYRSNRTMLQCASSQRFRLQPSRAVTKASTIELTGGRVSRPTRYVLWYTPEA
jgi:hypothetical protein